MIDAPALPRESRAPVRLRPPGWRDPRLLAGIVLVAISVALGSWLVASAGRTVPVFVADGALTPGEPVTRDALRVVDVRLSAGIDRYLRADEELPSGLVAQRVVADGELVSRSGLGDGSTMRSVALPISGGVSERIRPGAVADLWFVPDARSGPLSGGSQGAESGNTAAEPGTLAEGVVVEQVEVPDGALVVAGTTTLHVLVEQDALPRVLAALAEPGSLAVVPVGGAVR
ncbi:flagellar protein FlgA [Myceligenerans halotolerans]